MGQDQSIKQKASGGAETTPIGAIVVVKSGKHKTKDQQINKDYDQLKLEQIPNFYPLMKSTLNKQDRCPPSEDAVCQIRKPFETLCRGSCV